MLLECFCSKKTPNTIKRQSRPRFCGTLHTQTTLGNRTRVLESCSGDRFADVKAQQEVCKVGTGLINHRKEQPDDVLSQRTTHLTQRHVHLCQHTQLQPHYRYRPYSLTARFPSPSSYMVSDDEPFPDRSRPMSC